MGIRKLAKRKSRLRQVTMLATVCMMTAATYASPVIRKAITFKQPDGTTLTILPWGDEHKMGFTTTDGISVKPSATGAFVYIADTTLIAHNPEQRTEHERTLSSVTKRTTAEQNNAASISQTISIGPRIGEMNIHKGSPRIPVILVAFTDKPFSEQDPAEGFRTRLCRPATTEEIEQGKGSAYQYFSDQSHGLFTPQFDIIGPITLTQNAATYANNETEMVRQAIKAASDEGLVESWAVYDQNGDGKVDASYIIYAGEGKHAHPYDQTLIWPHTSVFLNNAPQADGVSFYNYSCCNETLYGKMDGFGTFCHEFSHQLGLPDFYRTDGSTSDSFNMGPWSLMDYGSYNADGFIPVGYRAIEKWAMGWEEPILLDKPATINNWADGAQAFRICNSVDNNEYYLIETMGHSRWNKACAAEGILISHIYLSGAFDNTYWKDNTLNNTSQPRVHIIAADNDRTQLVTGVNDAEYAEKLKGDLYPGPQNNNELTDSSTPAAEVYVGLWGVMSKPITGISYDPLTERAGFLFMGGDENNIITGVNTVTNTGDTNEQWWDMNGNIYMKKPTLQGIYIHKKADHTITKEAIH